jgi:hypothetical protein
MQDWLIFPPSGLFDGAVRSFAGSGARIPAITLARREKRAQNR